jgi:polysaccharide biosynthesis transport protein
MKQEFGMPDAIGVPPEDTDLSLFELGQMLRRQWQAALAIAALVFAGMAFSTLSKTPQYQSQTLILLENEKSAAVIPGLEATGLTTTPKDLSTEIQILRSYALVASALSPDEAGKTASVPPGDQDAASEKIRETAFGELLVSEAIENLAIRQAGDADVLIVSYTDTDPQRAKAVLEVLGGLMWTIVWNDSDRGQPMLLFLSKNNCPKHRLNWTMRRSLSANSANNMASLIRIPMPKMWDNSSNL